MKRMLTVWLDVEDYDRLKDEAWQRKLSMAAYVRQKLLPGVIELGDLTEPAFKAVQKGWTAPTNMTPTLAAKRIRDEKGNRI